MNETPSAHNDGRYASVSPGAGSGGAGAASPHTVTSTTLFIGGRVVSASPPGQPPPSLAAVSRGSPVPDEDTVTTHIRAHQQAVDNAILQTSAHLVPGTQLTPVQVTHYNPQGLADLANYRTAVSSTQMGAAPLPGGAAPAAPAQPPAAAQSPQPPPPPANRLDQGESMFLTRQLQTERSLREEQARELSAARREMEKLRQQLSSATPTTQAQPAGRRRREVDRGKMSGRVEVLLTCTEQGLRRVYYARLMANCRRNWKRATMRLWHTALRQFVGDNQQRLRAKYWRKLWHYSATKVQRGVIRLVARGGAAVSA